MKERLLVEVQQTTDGRQVEVSIVYDKGGMQYLSGRTLSRGYYAEAQVVKITEVAGIGMRVSGGYGSIISNLIETAPRFSQRRLQQLRDEFRSTAIYPPLLAALCARNNVALTQEAAASGGSSTVAAAPAALLSTQT